MQFGLDKILSEQDDGSRLVGGITAHYGNGDTSVRSVYGDGSIDTEHYGMGATLTWFGTRGVYIDGQANFNWFDSDLNSKTLGRLSTGNNGTGQAYSFEIGMRTAIKGKLSLTPQFQMVYSTVDFDTFADPSDAVVSASKGDSLKTRWGVSLDYRDEEGPAERTHLYGLADLSYEWRGGAQVDVSGTPLAHRDGRLWLNVGAGGTRSWDNGRKAVFGEVQATTATRDFGSSYGFKGVLGFRVGF
jgi:fibronectin-binding autotransporter adhesin